MAISVIAKKEDCWFSQRRSTCTPTFGISFLGLACDVHEELSCGRSGQLLQKWLIKPHLGTRDGSLKSLVPGYVSLTVLLLDIV